MFILLEFKRFVEYEKFKIKWISVLILFVIILFKKNH